MGIAAGHAFTEYAAVGETFDPPAVRKARLAKAVQLLRQLLDGPGIGLHRRALPVRAGRRARGRPGAELNAMVQGVVVTSDRLGAAQELSGQVAGLAVEDALDTRFLALGTHDQITEHLRRRRWGISYHSVRKLDAFAPVIERLRQVDAAADLTREG